MALLSDAEVSALLVPSVDSLVVPVLELEVPGVAASEGELPVMTGLGEGAAVRSSLRMYVIVGDCVLALPCGTSIPPKVGAIQMK